ncbi:GNAT family N-acetyltransferase [Bradyrhizobium betae]|uniref:N-acetyltransferase domain-containing protein n=1 Tax=Bradyrhizobium betae TaxID=244734 RepID=A0A4Q1UI65_9BRAD|nr:GNAT family N-acetyltransferase [Bradyrhizobium betae]RXT34529.1 hypothetical protein B5V03_37910 [Bradyrhizobium betae]
MNKFSYRVAVSGDVDGILNVFAEVAPEVPTRVYSDTKGDHTDTKASIEGAVGTGQSWVATDANGTIVGYALANGDDKALTLLYLGVSQAARNQHVCSSLVSKLKETSAAINTDVRSNNKSSMVERFEHLEFVKGNINEDRTKLHWQRPAT